MVSGDLVKQVLAKAKDVMYNLRKFTLNWWAANQIIGMKFVNFLKSCFAFLALIRLYRMIYAHAA